MNTKLLSLLLVVSFIGLAPAVFYDVSDAVSSDPEYREPPSADYVIEITQDLSFKSNDPEYNLYILSTDMFVDDDVFPAVSEDSQDDMAEFVKRIRNIDTSVDNATSDGWTDACVPSWINASFVVNDQLFGDNKEGIRITIMPSLQQLQEDTHGEYWIYYSTTQDSPALYEPNTKTFLFTFAVDVEWNGTVIVPGTYNQFIVNWDYGDGYVVSSTPVTVASDVTSLSFPIPSEIPEREGMSFVGFSASKDGGVIDAANVVVHVGDSNVAGIEDGSGGMVYTATFYAVWEQEHLVFPTFWDGLMELFTNPVVLLIGLIFFLSVCYFIRVRTTGGRRCRFP